MDVFKKIEALEDKITRIAKAISLEIKKLPDYKDRILALEERVKQLEIANEQAKYKVINPQDTFNQIVGNAMNDVNKRIDEIEDKGATPDIDGIVSEALKPVIERIEKIESEDVKQLVKDVVTCEFVTELYKENK